MYFYNQPYFKKNNITPVLKAGSAAFLALSMIIFPQETFQAAFRGLDAWWSIVFPALLPFFIVSELLIGLGVVHFMGVILEPIMRPLFNVPGCGAFVMAMGYTSGSPIGTMLSVELRKKKLCSRLEAQRLMSFTNNSSPLFIFGAVSVGMLHDPSLGIILAFSHYCANIIIGLILRFYGNDRESLTNMKNNNAEKNMISRAFQELISAQNSDGRTVATLLSDAVKKSANTLTMIGGFIIFFSVLIQILDQLLLLNLMSAAFSYLLSFLGVDTNLAPALSTGFFEITLGTKLVSETSAPLSIQLIAASSLLGWGGLSIHAQVASIIKDTDIKIKTFVASRITHSILAAFITIQLTEPVQPVINSITSSGTYKLFTTASGIMGNQVTLVLCAFLLFIMVCLFATLITALIYLFKNISLINLR